MKGQIVTKRKEWRRVIQIRREKMISPDISGILVLATYIPHFGVRLLQTNHIPVQKPIQNFKIH
jgi:hypothetical protein